MKFLTSKLFKPQMVTPEQALPGRETPVLKGSQMHAVLGGDMLREPSADEEVLYLAGGCYWGVEEIYWEIPGVKETSAGFMGGYTPNPTYDEVCTGLTGHAETVRVVYDPSEVSAAELLKTFFEFHDPTSLNQQGNDVGTQYRSAIYFTTPEQGETAREMAGEYEKVLAKAHGEATIVTEMKNADQAGPFYAAEIEHQQYLHKNPFGYRCHSRTGLACPMPGAGPLATGE